MSDFIIRLRTPSGMKRYSFNNKNTLFMELKNKLYIDFKIQQENQYISKNTLNNPEFLIDCDNLTFEQLKIQNGDILYILLDENVKKEEPKAQTHKLTNKCQHNSKDRCIHCAYGDLGKETKYICNHPPTAKCVNCSDFKGTTGKGVCNHPPTAFCPNCAPEEVNDPNKPNDQAEKMKKMFCHCKNGQKCVYCTVQISAVKVDVIPFNKLVQDSRGLCHFKHGPNTQCPSCAVEPISNFKGNPKCVNGHLPWPGGCCSKCMPPNALVKQQTYRHCDYLSFQDDRVGNKFVSEWLKNPFIQRASLLFGYFLPEPEETKNPGAVRAHVHAMYYPPQDNLADGVNFQKDPKEENVLAVADKLGMRPVGWCVTVPHRAFDAKYGGEMILTAYEVRTAAAFQNKFKNPNSDRSSFVTVLFKLNADQHVEPAAYQVSDQCVALERDNVLTNTDDIGLLAIRKPKSDEFLPGVMYKNKLMNPNEPFIPDEFIAVASAPLKSAPFFKNAKFPFVATLPQIKAHLLQSKDDLNNSLSDFNLLIHLPSLIGLQSTLNICSSLKDGKQISLSEKVALEKAMK